jgi:hypothetical protein
MRQRPVGEPAATAARNCDRPRCRNRPLSKVRAMPYVYQEYPKWLSGPEVIVQNATEERCIRWKWSRDIGRAKANALQCSRADALALELAPEILALGARRRSCEREPWNACFRAACSTYREIAQALNECSRPLARGGRWAAGTLLRLMRRAETAVATGPTREIRE